MSGMIGGAGSKSGVIGTTELDYEEGVVSPVVLTCGSGSVTMKSSEDTLAYTKIGNRVFFQIDIDTTAMDNSDGSAVAIEGLPFTIASKLPSIKGDGISFISFILSACGVVISLSPSL